MKAFVVEHYGSGGLRAADVAAPQVGDNDVLVDIRAASVNPLDIMVANGEFTRLLRYRTPFVLGHDVAGVIVETGSSVTEYSVGDEVFARPRDLRIGTFAEAIAIDAADVARKPSSLSFVEAAAVPLVSLAAWQSLVDVAQVTPGDRVLVQAGAGGLGSTLIQLAKHLGAHVVTTVGTRNIEKVRALGADDVIDYRTTDFTDVVSDVDVVIDSLGAESLASSMSVLRPGGVAISVVGPPDSHFADQLGRPMLKPVMSLMSRRVRAHAKSLGVRYAFFFMHADGARLGSIAELYETGTLKPVVDRSIAFDRTLDAVDIVANGKANGKIVITH